jgi:hypothetical protein
VRLRIGAFAYGVFAALLCSATATAQTPSGPTFDCSRAQTAMSRAICQDPNTWDADWALSASYWAAYFSVDGPDRVRLRDGHVAWFKTVEDGCGLAANVNADSGRAASCIAQRYRARAAGYLNTLSGDARAEASLRPEALMAIQGRLVSMGFMAGNADGVFGAGTRQAIRSYRQTLGHAPADFLDAQERAALLRPAPAGQDRARNPFGEAAQQGRPSLPDPRFARDPFNQGQAAPKSTRAPSCLASSSVCWAAHLSVASPPRTTPSGDASRCSAPREAETISTTRGISPPIRPGPRRAQPEPAHLQHPSSRTVRPRS